MEISVAKEIINYCVDVCCVLAGGRGNRTGSYLSAEVAPRQGYSEHGILCLLLYVSLQNVGMIESVFAIFLPQH